MLLTTERHIAHLDLDSFFVSVECLRNSKLLGKSVLIGGGSDRGVVASCSYEARKFGVHSAMPIRMALRLCPQAIVVRSDFEQYSKYSRIITDIISDAVPLFEKASIDEFYIDISGMDKFFGCSKFISGLKKRVLKESGLPVSYGLASNKLLGKVSTNEVKPNGQIIIPFGEEKSYLAPLKINKLPGVGKETTLLLSKMGVETIKVLSEIPIEMMHNLLGKDGSGIWRKANGIDESPVVPFHEQKSISTENTFETDTIDMRFLHSELVRMTERIGFELRQENKLAGCVCVKVRYTNFDTEIKQRTITYTNTDNVLLETAKELFAKLYSRRMLIRLVGIKLTNLIPGNHQIRLFEDTEESIKLYQAIDSIKKQFGEKRLVKAGGLDYK